MLKSKKTTVSRDGTNIYYETHAGEQQLPIIFLLHGVGGDLDAWQYVENTLLSKGSSCIAVDLRGHGYSGHPRTFEKYKLEYFIEDFNAVLEAENLKSVILVGHSLGAILATHIALACPEKIEKLVLISSSYVPPAYLRLPVLKQAALFIMNVLSLISPPAFKPQHSIYPPQKFHKDYEPFGLIRTIWHNSLLSYLLSSKGILLPELSSQIPKITMPTLILSGDKDSIFPTSISRRIHQNIKGSEFKIIPNGNHVLVLNNFEQVAQAILDFCK